MASSISSSWMINMQFQQWHLETVSCRADSTAFRRISADTLYGLLTSMTDQQFNSKYILIDCRYPFEYDGGHIRVRI